jgi:hypothetical protein
MKQLTKKYRIIHDNGAVRVDMKDCDMTGTITRTNDNYSVIDSNDFNDVASQVENNSLNVEYEQLPEQGKWVEGEKIYRYNDELLKCIQGHYRTIYEPSETPALFNLVPGEGNDSWQENVSYQTGSIVEYNGNNYKCIQKHTSQSDWTPDTTQSLWRPIAEPSTTDEWQSGVSYSVGDQVVYNSIMYECLQAHTSQLGWEPPNVPALWSEL